MKNTLYDAWPQLPYDEFKSTAHLLHMAVQMIGKLKLTTPFEPHWANVALWLSGNGLTTGLIPYETGAFSIDVDLIHHDVTCMTTWGQKDKLALTSMSVAAWADQFFALLKKLQINMQINSIPQELTHPIPFEQDTAHQDYQAELANAWWRILVSSYKVMQRYHARFDGETPPIGLMWGTFDLRDARYNGVHVPTTGPNAGYIRRNAMNEAQVEVGWWHGNDLYQRPAYYSFTYPQPNGIERVGVQPKAAHWSPDLGEFLLDYDDVRSSPQPEKDLFQFFESTYQAGATTAGWKAEFITDGEPA